LIKTFNNLKLIVLLIICLRTQSTKKQKLKKCFFHRSLNFNNIKRMSILTSKKNFLKIVVLGDANVGKTSLLTRYTEDKSPISTKPTIGADFKKKEVVINESTVTV